MAIRKLSFGFAALLLGAVAWQADAVTITTQNWGAITGPATTAGALANQDTVLELNFSLNAASELMFYTTSYGGGMNADGSMAAGGGFMPSLVLYSSSGNYVAGETFPSPIGNNDPSTGLNGDSYLSSGMLAAGSYILTLSDFQVQQPPTAMNLSDGFTNYGNGTFLDAQSNLRTGAYSLSVKGAGVSATPEPATFWLIMPALGLAAFWMWRRRDAVQAVQR